MKFLLTILMSLLLHTALFANKIDDLKTDADVENFIQKHNKWFKNYKVVTLEKLYPDKAYKKIADSLHVKNWQITDFDNNGFSDLLVYGLFNSHATLLAITSNGRKFSYHYLERGYFRNFHYPTVENIKGTNTLLLKGIKYPSWEEKLDEDNVALIYKFNTFIEPNNNLVTHKISKIEYETSECFGTCPVFKIEIDANRNTIYNAIEYNDLTGIYYSKISQDDYYTLIRLINYLDFPNLKDRYKVNWTDDQSYKLIITYDDGKTKTINDYGKAGTYGLIQVYDKLFDLRKKLEWEE